MIGYQPNSNDDPVADELQAVFGANRIVLCEGIQSEVARAMRRCDLFLAWNDLWSLVCGRGESFGLALYEAMASGCVCVARQHCGNEGLRGVVVLDTDIGGAIDTLQSLRDDRIWKEMSRIRQSTKISARYRFDDARAKAIAGYLDTRYG
jgi:glycosyltransferase involved in cell wall biosynthesis